MNDYKIVILLISLLSMSDGSSRLIDGDMEILNELGLQGIIKEHSRWGNTIKYHIRKYPDVRRTLPSANITTALKGIEDAVSCLTFEEFEEEFTDMYLQNRNDNISIQ